MGRKQKYNEKSRVLTIRIPESRYDEIKSHINQFLENDNEKEYSIQKNDNIEYLKFLMDFFQLNKKVLIPHNKAFLKENQEKFNIIVNKITGGK